MFRFLANHELYLISKLFLNVDSSVYCPDIYLLNLRLKLQTANRFTMVLIRSIRIRILIYT